MQIRCHNCFQVYDDVSEMCPHCGFMAGEPGKEPYYLVPGTILKEHYVIGEVVGAGGFGITYKAWDTVLERKVAIKEYYPVQMVTRVPGEEEVVVFLNKREAEFKKGLYDFLQEAKIMSQFRNSENVCNSYDQFEMNGTAYIVMEFLEGQTLKGYVKSRKENPLEEAEILTIISQVLSGLEDIHKNNVIHLDIAPDNIWIMPDGRIKIIDFGAAKSKQVKKDNETIILKPGFAPPEQYRRNGKIGPWTDIYAVGATLYFLLTGEVPLESSDRDKEDVMQEPAMLAVVSKVANDVTMRAMAVRPELRFKTAKEFATELYKEKVRSLENELKRRKRNRRNFLLAMAVTLTAVASMVVYYGMFKNKVQEDSLLVWVSVDNALETAEAEKARYALVAEQFNEIYPQVTVEIVVKDSECMEADFWATAKSDRPDLIETGALSTSIVDELVSLESVMERYGESMLSAIVPAVNDKEIPTGCYINVIYAEIDKQLSELIKKNTLDQFISEKTGYCESDSRFYFEIQGAVAGRYQVIESLDKQVHLADKFGVYRRSANKKKAAVAFLEYMLTDAAQDVLYVQNQSGYMPVVENAWMEFLNVYSELEYLEKSIDIYSVIAE